MVKKYFCLCFFIVFSWQNISANEGLSRSGLTELTLGQTLNSVFLAYQSSYALDLYYRQTVGLSILYV